MQDGRTSGHDVAGADGEGTEAAEELLVGRDRDDAGLEPAGEEAVTGADADEDAIEAAEEMLTGADVDGTDAAEEESLADTDGEETDAATEEALTGLLELLTTAVDGTDVAADSVTGQIVVYSISVEVVIVVFSDAGQSVMVEAH